MRPRSFYAVFDYGRVVAISHGAAEARQVTGCRAYRAFKTRTAAEEFAAWWNYERDKKAAAEAAAREERIAARLRLNPLMQYPALH